MIIKSLFLAVYGSLDNYLSLLPTPERAFWSLPCPGSLWQAAKNYPRGQWFLAKAILVRLILPYLLPLVTFFIMVVGIIIAFRGSL